MSAYLIAATLLLATFFLVAVIPWRDYGQDSFAFANRRANTIQVGSGLFTLVGGGEIATLVFLGFLFGWSAMFLFFGYSLGFVFLGLMAEKVKSREKESGLTSLPDYLGAKFNNQSRVLGLVVAIFSFFALLLLQLVVGGRILSALLGVAYPALVIALAAFIAIYLCIRGFVAVLQTDVVQGIAMALLAAFCVGLSVVSDRPMANPSFESMPIFFAVSLLGTGFFVAIASADVWQRAYAAQTVEHARRGFFLGALVLLLLGAVFAYAGMLANGAGINVADPASALQAVFGFSEIARIAAALLVLSAIISTADTELFLVATLLESGTTRFAKSRTKNGLRVFITAVAAAASLTALFLHDAVEVYTWLLLLLLCISPVVFLSLFFSLTGFSANVSIWFSLATFAALIYAGKLNFDNAFLITLVGTAALGFGELFARFRNGDET